MHAIFAAAASVALCAGFAASPAFAGKLHTSSLETPVSEPQSPPRPPGASPMRGNGYVAISMSNGKVGSRVAKRQRVYRGVWDY